MQRRFRWLYEHPRNVFVGGFIGSPAMNMLEAVVQHEGGKMSVLLGDSRIELHDAMVKERPGLAGYDGRQVVLGIRPEGFEDAALSAGSSRLRIRAKAELREALGSEVLLHASIGARKAITEEVRELAEDVGDDRTIGQLTGTEAPREALIVARLSPRTRIHEGDTVELTIDESTLHFFDQETGVAINGSEPAP